MDGSRSLKLEMLWQGRVLVRGKVKGLRKDLIL